MTTRQMFANVDLNWPIISNFGYFDFYRLEILKQGFSKTQFVLYLKKKFKLHDRPAESK